EVEHGVEQVDQQCEVGDAAEQPFEDIVDFRVDARLHGRSPPAWPGSFSSTRSPHATPPRGACRRGTAHHLVELSQYSSYMCSPPWAGLPISAQLRKSSTRSRCTSGNWPMRTGTVSGTSSTSIVQLRP